MAVSSSIAAVRSCPASALAIIWAASALNVGHIGDILATIASTVFTSFSIDAYIVSTSSSSSFLKISSIALLNLTILIVIQSLFSLSSILFNSTLFYLII